MFELLVSDDVLLIIKRIIYNLFFRFSLLKRYFKNITSLELLTEGGFCDTSETFFVLFVVALVLTKLFTVT